MKKKTLSLISLAAVLLIGLTVMILLTSFKAEAQKEEERENIRIVETKELVAAAQTVWIEADGFLEAARELDLTSPVGGKLTYALGRLGGGVEVAEGEILFRLDDSRARLAFDSARTTLVQQVNQFLTVAGLAGREQARWEGYLDALETSGPDSVPPLPESDRRVELLAVTKGVYSAAYALESAALDLRDHSLSAPFAGVLTGDGVTVGTWVSPGIPLARLVETEHLVLTLSLSAGDLLHVAPGDGVLLERPEDGASLPGRIERIEPVLSSQSQTARIHVALTVPGGERWMPGSFVTARIGGERFESACRIPREALTGGRIPLYREGQLVLEDVAVLAVDGNDLIIRADFPPETEYVTTRLQNPMTGMKLGKEQES